MVKITTNLVIRTLSFVVLTSLMTACTSSDFTGSGSSQAQKTKSNGGDDQTLDAKNNVSQPSSTSTSNSTPDTLTPECISGVLPLRVMLILDVSSSMTEQIETVKNTLVEFGVRLKNITPQGATQPIHDLKIGLITFIDTIQEVYPLTANIDALSQQIASVRSLNISSNTDTPEGGLAGAYQGLTALQEDSPSGEAITVLVLVSDTFAHNGGGMPFHRSYDTKQLDSLIASKSFGYLRLFDATPQTPGDIYANIDQGIPTGLVPADQWSAVRTSWRSAHGSTSAVPGGALGFPPSTQTLLEQVPTDLQNSLKVCK